MLFVIKKVNPFLDFPADKVPQIFTDYISRRKVDPLAQPTQAEIQKIQEQMYAYVKAGVAHIVAGKEKLPLVEREKKEEGVTVEDLFRDQQMGYKLYWEIMNHSLNQFKGLRGVFFSIKRRFWLFMHLRLSMGRLQSISYCLMAGTVCLKLKPLIISY